MVKYFLKIILVLIPVVLSAQNNTNSPYSIFGLGSTNKTSSAGLTALGNTGIAENNPYIINLLNSSSLGNIRSKSFIFEFGFNGSSSTFKNSDNESKINNINLSHIALAFPVKNNWGIGLGLIPQTKVGYEITSEKAIEGSADSFTTFTTGTGGINKLYLSNGIKLGKVVSVGVDIAYLFGSINDLSEFYSDVLVSINNENHYKGISIGSSFQYTFPNKKTSIGGTFTLATKLKGIKTVNSFKTSDLGSISFIQNDEVSDIETVELPMAFGVGITSNIYKDFTASLDFRKRLWNDTSQSIEGEQYTNQNTYGFGLEFDPSVNNLKYWNKLKYRLGFNYDSGFLVLSDKQIDSYFISAGAEIPINKTGQNNLNISYSYGKEGTTENNLVQENFHKLTFNLSFVGSWFKDRKIF